MHIDVNGLISQYGYWALLIGCLAEGETFTLLGGVAAHEGLLRYGWVVLIAALGGTLGDQILFYIGRHYGTTILGRFKKHQDKIAKANKMIRRRPTLFVIGVRFMYGFRLIGPVIIGASRLSPGRFFLLNIIGALLWSLIFVSLGYVGGQVIAPWLHQLDQHLKHLLWLVAAIVLVWGVRLAFRRWSNKREQ
ncbi:DedA family protein [Winslowiella iniecta]|uniref:Membrane protein n=1 Tax=Winslowiella iniecta TaxID=1560201 RepID=A0A0L7TCC9_9GAMM|nr:DedA family protein [Winslowiella iniecta]KOC92866.1 membrane protein [Winslowiella iniecta]KOC95215.1 membrane protein [Winslowiella iniecta]